MFSSPYLEPSTPSHVTPSLSRCCSQPSCRIMFLYPPCCFGGRAMWPPVRVAFFVAGRTVRANVYIDGFNLYYGLKHYERLGRRYKWLDLAALCRAELPNDTIHRIRYCTALVQPRPYNPGQDIRQQIYLRALRTIPNLSIDYGHFLQSYVWMALRNPPPGGNAVVEVIKTEEKGSDVNLATRLLCDGFAGDYEVAVVIPTTLTFACPSRSFGSSCGSPSAFSTPLNASVAHSAERRPSTRRSANLPWPPVSSCPSLPMLKAP